MVQGPACSYIQKFFTDTCHQSDHHYQTFKSLYKVLLSAAGILLLPYHQSVHIILLSITISSFSNMSSFQHPGCLSLTQKSKIQKHLPCWSFFTAAALYDLLWNTWCRRLHTLSCIWATYSNTVVYTSSCPYKTDVLYITYLCQRLMQCIPYCSYLTLNYLYATILYPFRL